MKHIILSVTFIFMAICVFAQKAPSHQPWDKLLKKNVNASGMVNYKGFQKDKAELDSYLKILSDNAPDNSWSENDQKAYWINAYNAFTVSLIMQHYPVKASRTLLAKVTRSIHHGILALSPLVVKNMTLIILNMVFFVKDTMIPVFTLPLFVLRYLVLSYGMKHTQAVN